MYDAELSEFTKYSRFSRLSFPAGNHSGDSIEIEVLSLGNRSYFDKYEAWRDGDEKLEWTDPPASQKKYQGIEALGTPTALTTDVSGDPGYHQLNT